MSTPRLLCRFSHPVGHELLIWIEATGNGTHIHEIAIDTTDGKLAQKGAVRPTTELGRRFAREIKSYLHDPTHKIDLPLWDHEARDTQRAAMEFLRNIPLGQTRSYSQQAGFVRRRCGNGFNSRNAGNANRGNHYPLAIPCHRVVRADGDVGGFMGTTRPAARALKGALLAHEGVRSARL